MGWGITQSREKLNRVLYSFTKGIKLQNIHKHHNHTNTADTQHSSVFLIELYTMKKMTTDNAVMVWFEVQQSSQHSKPPDSKKISCMHSLPKPGSLTRKETSLKTWHRDGNKWTELRKKYLEGGSSYR